MHIKRFRMVNDFEGIFKHDLKLDLRRVDLTVYSFNTYFQHISSSIVEHWVCTYILGIFFCLLELPPWFKHSYVRVYKRTCDIINIYKLYKVKAWEFTSHCYCLREGVGLKGRDISGSDLIPLKYAFNHLVNDKVIVSTCKYCLCLKSFLLHIFLL